MKKSTIQQLSIALFCLTLWSCKQPNASETPAVTAEPYRPQFHFTPEKTWTNDPNGLVYYKGEYHLFYQDNPYGVRWGHMSWGHAVSTDLLHWKHLPVAIEEYPDPNGRDSVMIFSGSAVMDRNNSSGFFQRDSAGMVAIYTSHVHSKGEQLAQHQSIAYSSDRGRTFKRFEGNPVLDIGRREFRDPKVIWYEPQQKWVMVTVIPNEFKTHFYESKDLKSWKFLSEFGPVGDTAKVWECPDLLQVTLPGETDIKKWVLIVSNSHPQGPAFVGIQYFVGEFDGTKFTADNPRRYPLYIDYGKDLYAAVTYNNLPDDRVIMIGWANNWTYGQDIPTSPWRSAMSIPRELSLYSTPDGPQLRQAPVREWMTLKGEKIADLSKNTDRSLVMNIRIKPGTSGRPGVKLFVNGDEWTMIGYDAAKKEAFVDRTHSGNVSFHTAFPSVDAAKVVPDDDGWVTMEVFVDQSIIEAFINSGQRVMTEQIFPLGSGSGIEVVEDGGEVLVEAWKVKM